MKDTYLRQPSYFNPNKGVCRLRGSPSEIQFYLEEVDLSYVDANNVITLIENEYLVDYYYKIGNADKEGAFFTSLLRNKVYNQQKLRFGISSEK